MTAGKQAIEKKPDTKNDWLVRPVKDADGMADLVVRAQQQIADMSAGRFDAQKVARLTLLTKMAARKNPQLLTCTAGSLLWSFLDAARCGLEWDGVEGALVPYGTEARFLPMFQGFIRLATGSGVVRKIVPVVVYREDDFKVLRGSDDRIHHAPSFTGDKRDADIIAAYAIATLPSGEQQFEVMDRHAIDRVRSSSKNANRGPWVDWFPAMARKSAVRQLWKYLGRRIAEVDSAIEVDDRAEMLDPHLSRPLDAITTSVTTTRGTAGLAAALKRDPPSDSGETLGAPPPSVVHDPADGDGKGSIDVGRTPDAVEPPAKGDPDDDREITDTQRDVILGLADKAGAVKPEDRLRLISSVVGHEVGAVGGLTKTEAEKVIDALREMIAKAGEVKP